MKKLSNLKLKKFHEMSISEMKNVIGGYDDSYDGGYDGYDYGAPMPCPTSSDICFGDCSVKVPGQLLPVKGKCQISYALFPYYTGCACIV